MAPRDPEKSDLKYLQDDVREELPPEIEKLLTFLDVEEAKLGTQIQRLRERYELSRGNDKEAAVQVNKNELRISDLWSFRKLLVQHAKNPDVKEVSEAMNRVYSVMFAGGRPAPDFDNMPFRNKVDALLDRGSYEDLRMQYWVANERLDDTLDVAQTQELVDRAAHGYPDALFETYVSTIDRYQELIDKILFFPKEERDKNIDVLLKTLVVYEELADGEYQKKMVDQLGKRAEDVLKNQQKRFEGLRGLIQKGVEKTADFAIDHLSGVFGDEESVARNLFIQAAKFGKDLSKPIEYDPALIKALKDEAAVQLAQIADVVDPHKIQEMKDACVDLKANPDRLLSENDREAFSEKFKEFLPQSTALIRRIIDVQGDLLRDAYILSHGKNSKYFEADSTLRAKFFAHEGRDFIRTLQIYSPFGIFMPAQLETKDGQPLYVKSVYRQGWFNEHPILSTALQAGEFGASLYLTYHAVRLASKLSLVTRILGKIIGKPIKKLAPYVGAVWAAAEITEELKDYHISGTEQEIFETLNEYDSFREIPDDVREDLRQLILRNEIERRRGLFQAVGYDLEKFDMPFWDRFLVGNYGTEGMKENDVFKDSMKTQGTFREAVLAANRKMVLIGLKPFEIK